MERQRRRGTETGRASRLSADGGRVGAGSGEGGGLAITFIRAGKVAYGWKISPQNIASNISLSGDPIFAIENSGVVSSR